MSTMSGNATADGVGIDKVMIVDTDADTVEATAIPDSGTGDWSATVSPGTYHVLYLNSGCEPVCNGPYTVS